MAKKKITSKNIQKVVERILALSKDEQKTIFEAFDRAIDRLSEEDFFGTEGQSDPRGDQRE